MDAVVLHIQSFQIHAEYFFALLIVRPGEFFSSRRAPDDGGIERPCPVCTEEHEDAPRMTAKIVYLLDDGVYGYFVLVMALGRVPRRRE